MLSFCFVTTNIQQLYGTCQAFSELFLLFNRNLTEFPFNPACLQRQTRQKHQNTHCRSPPQTPSLHQLNPIMAQLQLHAFAVNNNLLLFNDQPPCPCQSFPMPQPFVPLYSWHPATHQLQPPPPATPLHNPQTSQPHKPDTQSLQPTP